MWLDGHITARRITAEQSCLKMLEGTAADVGGLLSSQDVQFHFISAASEKG
jgi:hypothetical protein